MIKKSVVIFAALTVVGAAYAKFIPCPANVKSIADGKVYKDKAGSWRVSYTDSKTMPVKFPIKVSYPGLTQGKVEGKPGLACYDDDKRPDKALGKPLYAVTFGYMGSCNNPVVDSKRNGFECH